MLSTYALCSVGQFACQHREKPWYSIDYQHTIVVVLRIWNSLPQHREARIKQASWFPLPLTPERVLWGSDFVLWGVIRLLSQGDSRSSSKLHWASTERIILKAWYSYICSLPREGIQLLEENWGIVSCKKSLRRCLGMSGLELEELQGPFQPKRIYDSEILFLN